MSGLGRCVRRLAAGTVGVVVAVALIWAPAAWASGDTITTATNVQFNGVIDSAPQCSDATAISINWGDGSPVDTMSGHYLSNGQVVGTHTYGAAGSYTGSITLTGGTSGTCLGNGSPDAFTATVGAPPLFTECPQVGVDLGCQFLIDITPNGTQILQDTTQGPYESSEDALIGVKNDSSSPLSSIPISTPSGSGTFSFDGDGMCDNGSGPWPAGCQLIGSAGKPCDPTATDPNTGATLGCAFPSDPGQPGPNPDPYPNSTQNGYEGPTTFYTSVSADVSSGVVNFSPALQPGQSTYFSLEEPPSANAINVGSMPVGGGLSAAPTVTATSASFVAIVNPNGSATTGQFVVSLDPRYGSLVDAPQSTPAQSIGGDFANHVVTATVTGLVPNALYHVHFVASNHNGQTVGPDVTFSTSRGPTPGSPVLGRSVNISLVRGLVLVRINGALVPLTEPTQIRTGTLIDAVDGTIELISAVPAHPAGDLASAAKKHKGKTTTQSGTFNGGIFKVTQAHSGLTTLTLVEGAFTGAPTYASCGKKAADASAAALSSKTLQLLHASAKGKFSTRGKFAAATVRGTKWGISDRCDGTLVRDRTDSVVVTDFVHHKTIILHAGQTYLAKKH